MPFTSHACLTQHFTRPFGFENIPQIQRLYNLPDKAFLGFLPQPCLTRLGAERKSDLLDTNHGGCATQRIRRTLPSHLGSKRPVHMNPLPKQRC